MASHPRDQGKAPPSSVTVDRLFAPAPHGLINDPQISHAAFRLWCVLHRLSWIREPPEMERLCAELRQGERTPDRRSVYRWLSELESRGWLRWQRTPGKASVNRFLVLSERQPVTPESQVDEPVTPESQPVTPESQPVTPESQVPPIQPPPERMKNASQNHEIYRDHDGDGVGRTRAFLVDMGIGAAAEFAHLPYEQTKADYDARRADNQTNAIIVKAWRSNPPTKDYHYGQRPLQSDVQPNRTRRSGVATRSKGSHNPTGGAELRDPGWMDRLIAKAENGEL